MNDFHIALPVREHLGMVLDKENRLVCRAPTEYGEQIVKALNEQRRLTSSKKPLVTHYYRSFRGAPMEKKPFTETHQRLDIDQSWHSAPYRGFCGLKPHDALALVEKWNSAGTPFQYSLEAYL